MSKKIKSAFQAVGIIGTLACLGIFIKDPSFPTPDKLIVFLAFVFMSFSQTKIMLKRLLPFVAILLVYESFRGIADSLNTHVNFTFAPHMDRLLFGNLPTVYLQNWLWHGHVQWYDIVLYLPYLIFFIVPIGLAILIWKTRDKYYWEVVTTYLAVFYAAFLTFLIFPAAPPWMAAQDHIIQPIVRISSDVWASIGMHSFPSFYNEISPNPVAAVPSLHSACSVLFSLFVFKIYGKRWGYVSLLYPILLIIGVIYEGEHYAFDVILGAGYAVAGFIFVPKAMPALHRLMKRIDRKIKSVLAWRPTK